MDLRLTVDVSLENPIEGDLYLEDGQVVFFGDSDASRQDIMTRLRFFLGEWFLDTREGVPYFEEILKKNPNLPLIKRIFRQAVEGSPYISSVQDLQLVFERSTRTLSISFVAILEDGGIIDTDDFKPIVISL